ncbi:MAG: response regulator SirA [Ignavibacteria bacterium RBG_13_36_8]|nr:MAG: response regulator SirA [Ignavibacteria bacterium RBG_13_36_8]
MTKFTKVIKRNGATVDFNPGRIANVIYRAAVAVGGRDKQKAEKLAKYVIKYMEEKYPDGYTPHVEEVQDAIEKILIEHGHAKVAKEFILYREERIRKRDEEEKHSFKPSENIPWSKIWHILGWAVSHDVHTVAALNGRIKKGEFVDLVKVSEAAYHEDITFAADLIVERAKNLKMVLITGPSSSGKTTTTIKLEGILKKSGLKFKALNIDNYFFDLEMHPKDEFGDYDFETPQALDLELINEQLKQIIDGKEVMIPFYDFKTGTRRLNNSSFKIAGNEILLIDSLHGLYPKMTAGIPDERKFRLYLEPLLQMKGPDDEYIRWTDLRLIRRMLRDSVYRAYNPQQTLEHWHYVRRSEMRNIFPYINTADYIINSGMPYEVPLYAAKLLKSFEEWEKNYKDNPLRQDAYLRSARLYKVLKSVEPVANDSPVPKDSVLREFIGGSIYEY